MVRAPEEWSPSVPVCRERPTSRGPSARTRASVYGEDAYPDLHAKAAALLHSIVTGRALIDGNKRLGWVTVRLFYRLNGSDPRVPTDDAFDLVMSIADGSLRDIPDIADRLRPSVKNVDGTE
jgi:death-on-curing protein